MAQLFMRRPTLAGLPPLASLPPGYARREANVADAAAIAAVLSSAFGEEWMEERVRAVLLAAPDVVATFVITAGEAPVATAAARLLPEIYPGSGYLHWVGVHTAHRGMHFGGAVSLAVLHRFRDLGCRDAVLETDPFRLPALRTYLRLGFLPEPVAPEHEQVWRETLAKLGRPET